MLTLLGANKWIVYLIAALSAAGIIASLLLVVRKGGADAERTKQLSDALKSLSTETKERAKIEAMKSSEARSKLKSKWSQK